ncbi:MAG TPA: RNA 2',3'-cyclic phosphodiesterase [Hyphomicrobium sp.]|jgi:2'-5' RNA ligase
MPRLFTGIEIPEEQREELTRLRLPLPGNSRWIETENLHLTLRFAGDIDNAQAREFADRLAGITVDAFEMRLSGLGAFGGNEPRSIWAGIDAGPELETLARACERAAREAGLAPETRTFKPHVTVARLKHASARDIARVLGRIGAFRGRPFPVSRFVLFSSRPKLGGGPYVVEEAFPLRGGEFADFHDVEGGW